MCITFPGCIVAIDGTVATVEVEGHRRAASTLFVPDLNVGDWVSVAAGTITGRLEPGAAAEIAATIRDLHALARPEARALEPVALATGEPVEPADTR